MYLEFQLFFKLKIIKFTNTLVMCQSLQIKLKYPSYKYQFLNFIVNLNNIHFPIYFAKLTGKLFEFVFMT